MTAQKVDGRAVVAEERVESPISTPSRPVHFTRVVRLLLDDDSVVYGCTECEYTTETWFGVARGHLPRAHPKTDAKSEARQAEAPPSLDPSSISLADLLGAANQVTLISDALERVVADRDQWRTRAMKAERALATLRKVLK